MDKNERIKYLYGSIKDKKKQIFSTMLSIGFTITMTTLFGIGLGLILDKFVKATVACMAGGILLSTNNIIKIKNLNDQIDIDNRELMTLKKRNTSSNVNNTNNANLGKTQSINNNVSNQKNYIDDNDMDKMIDLFKNKKYEFKHDSNAFENDKYDDDIHNKTR